MQFIDIITPISALILFWVVYRAHKNPNYQLDLFDLIIDSSTGKISRIAVAFMVTLGVTSWVLVRLAIENKLTEGYFGAYGLMWVAPVITKLFNIPPPIGTVTTDTVSSTFKTITQTTEPTEISK